ncbi:uncharacterized protein LOC131049594 [Cryptomeria japonica]|uniref:uncharacterized protein LOC131049594 n=1 Tax=Cryptomeria japonica TaxID=3369 RepID=UPI0027DA588A|nr:uncharacterized protein LOC131049594 [Cryptomeria japonica]
MQKPIPPPNSQSTSSTGGAEKRKKEKRQRVYVVANTEDIDKEFDETAREVKKTTTYARMVKKPQFGGVKQTKKSRIEPESSGKAKESKKQKSKINAALKSGKIEGTFEIVPPLTLKELIDEILKDGNLKNVSTYYEIFDDKDQRVVEEAIGEYMDAYSKALIELASMFPKSLYDILDVRRHTTSEEDEKINEYVLMNLSFFISQDEVIRLLNLAKDIFQSKKRVNKLILGKIDEVTKESETILRHFLIDQKVDVNPEEPSHDTSVPEVHVIVPKQKVQSPEKSILKEVVSEKATVETENVEKDKEDGEKGGKDESAKVVDKEKGEEKAD